MDDLNLLKSARKWHTKVASILFVFFFIISITGLLLGWKNLFSTKIYKEESKHEKHEGKKDHDKKEDKIALSAWLPLDSLQNIATKEFKEKVPTATKTEAKGFTANIEKGSVRFSFDNNYNVQLDAQTGKLNAIDQKAPEWITHLHDGEIIDDIFGIDNGPSKKIYTAIMGLALFFMTLSGFWMWIKPLKIAKDQEKRKKLKQEQTK